MRKVVLSLFTIAGIALGLTGPASANAAAGLASKPGVSSQVNVEKVHWRGHHRRFGGLFFGFGYPAYYGYGYSRYRHYDDDYYYRPRYYYSHRRHFRHHRW